MNKFSFVILIVLVVLCQSCSEGETKNAAMRQAPSIPVIEVPSQTLTGYDTYPTSLEGVISSSVRAKVSGYITQVLVDEGQAVKKGQSLFKLETQSLDADAAAAKANVEAAKVDVDKLKPLVEKGIIGSVQLKTAEARYNQAMATFNSISANIGYATIKSPVSGYVGAIPYRQGALVSPSDPLTTVSQVDNVFAFFSMNEKQYLNMLQITEGESLDDKIGNMAEVELELVNGQIYSHKGKIKTITGQVNPTTGTVSFRATFPNPNRLLAHGNSGKVLIPKIYEDKPVIPEASIYEEQGKTYLYKVGADSVAVEALIEIEAKVGQLLIIEEGLKKGDKIVYQGLDKVRDQMKISPRLVPFDSVAGKLKVAFK
ncbi:efflux RND transporter periplasmic adaptor subunit [Cyclobacterium qasimii]|nr:efflux RND transporter periplasmic adaptor subunit [Cyclobacterium qasimii]